MQRIGIATAASLGLVLGMATVGDGQETKLSDCPAAVKKTIEAEAKGAEIGTVHKEKEEDATVYWTEAVIAGKTYALGVLEDGTLVEMNLAVNDAEVPFDRCPTAVQATFRHEAFGLAIKSVGKDRKYGVTIYETVVQHKGQGVRDRGRRGRDARGEGPRHRGRGDRADEVPRARPGHLPRARRGGTVGDVTRSTGITRPTFEAEVKIQDKVYLIEVGESGVLISKSLEAAEE